MEYMLSLVNNHNKTLKAGDANYGCNSHFCKGSSRESNPLEGYCLTRNGVYLATVKEDGGSNILELPRKLRSEEFPIVKVSFKRCDTKHSNTVTLYTYI